jgi:hypothetical protein
LLHHKLLPMTCCLTTVPKQQDWLIANGNLQNCGLKSTFSFSLYKLTILGICFNNSWLTQMAFGQIGVCLPLFVYWDGVLFCSPGWPPIHDSLDLVFLVLVL